MGRQWGLSLYSLTVLDRLRAGHTLSGPAPVFRANQLEMAPWVWSTGDREALIVVQAIVRKGRARIVEHASGKKEVVLVND